LNNIAFCKQDVVVIFDCLFAKQMFHTW